MFPMAYQTFNTRDIVSPYAYRPFLLNTNKQRWECPHRSYTQCAPTLVRLKVLPYPTRRTDGKKTGEDLASLIGHMLADFYAQKNGVKQTGSNSLGGPQDNKSDDRKVDAENLAGLDATSSRSNGTVAPTASATTSSDMTSSQSAACDSHHGCPSSSEKQIPRCEECHTGNNSQAQTWVTRVDIRGFAPSEVTVRVKNGLVQVTAKHEQTSGPGPCMSKYVMQRTVAVPEYADAERVACLMLPSRQLVLYAPRLPGARLTTDKHGNVVQLAGEDAAQARGEEAAQTGSADGGLKDERRAKDRDDDITRSEDKTVQEETSTDGLQTEGQDLEETCVMHIDSLDGVSCSASARSTSTSCDLCETATDSSQTGEEEVALDDTRDSADEHADVGPLPGVSHACPDEQDAQGVSHAYPDEQDAQGVSQACPDEQDAQGVSHACPDEQDAQVNEAADHTPHSTETVHQNVEGASGNVAEDSLARPEKHAIDPDENGATDSCSSDDVPSKPEPVETSLGWTSTDPTRPIKRDADHCVAATKDQKEPFILTFPLQNFRPEDIHVKVSDNQLIIMAETDCNYKTVVWKERVQRSVMLPEYVDLSSVKCFFQKDGHLIITALPK